MPENAERLLGKSPDPAEMMRFVAIVQLHTGQVYLSIDQSTAITYLAACATLLHEMQRRDLHLSPREEQLLEQLQPILNLADDTDSPSDKT